MGNGQCGAVRNCNFVCQEEKSITQNVRIIKVEDIKDAQEPQLITFSKISLSNNSRFSNSFAITPAEQSQQITSLNQITNSNIKKSLNQSRGSRAASFINIEIIDKISIKEFYELKKLVKNVQQTIKQLLIPRSYIAIQQATEDYIQKQKFVKVKFSPTEGSQTCYFRGNIIDKNQSKVLQGIGQIYFTSGAYYNGCFRNNQFSDKGLYIHSDKDYYYGAWKNNSAYGYGEFRHFQGVLYAGQWVNDQQHGYGEQYWPDGAVFKGDFKRGHKKKGRFSWPNKSYYEGEFVNDQFEGQGSFFWEDNRSYVGSWKANKMHGFGTFTWPNGQIFSGEYEADKKNGRGELTLNDGTIVKGKWLNGKLEGMSEIWKNGSVTKVRWKDGVEVKL